MAPTKVNIDLQNERNKCTFNVEELTNFLDEGPQNTKYRRELGKVMFFLNENGVPNCFVIF